METNFYKNKFMRLLSSMALIIGLVGFAQAQVTSVVFDAAPYVVGQTYEATFDYDGSYPAGSRIAVALVDADGNYTVLNSFPTDGAVVGEVLEFTIPDMDMDFEEIRLIAYEGDVLNDDNRIDFTLNDFILAKGYTAVFNSGPSFNNGFNMYAAGKREMLTKAYDLTNKENLELRFNYWILDGTINANGDENVIPRLEYSTNGGVSFEALEYTIPVNGSTLDGNLLYQSAFPYVVEIPASLLTETAVHFRWSQPLNGGLNADRWQLYNARLQYDNNVLNNAIYINAPADLIISPPLNNFTYTHVDKTTDPVFNGDDFSFTFELDDPVNDPDFPAGTEFVFTINSQDPVTGSNVVIANGSFDDKNFTGSIPSYISAGNYNVLLTATNTVDGAAYTYYDENLVGTVRVFNKFVATIYNGDPSAVLYAGSEVSFSADIQNNATNVSDYDDVYFNLVVNYAGEDWLLAARQGGIGQPLTADLPPFVTGNNNYQIRASINSPLGEVGQPIQNTNFRYTGSNNQQNFLNFSERLSYWNGCNGCGFFSNELQFWSKNGRRTVTTIDRDLSNSTLLNFELAFFNYNVENPDNHLILEYSTDGGTTFTALAEYPDMRFPNNTTWITEKITIPQDARTSATRFRFRQEEASGTSVRIRQMETTSIPEFPFTLSGVNVNVVRQEVFPTNSTASTVCLDEEYTLNYELRGQIGEDAQIEVRYRLENEGFYRNLGSFDPTEDGNLTLRLEDATDQPTSFPTGIVNVRFDIRINDQTFTDIGRNYTTNRVSTDQPIQLVPRVNQVVPVNVLTEECKRVLQIPGANVQDGFSYRVRNRITDDWMGDEVIAEAGSDLRFELGELDEAVDVEVVVTARNAQGDVVCGKSSVLNSSPQIKGRLFLGEDNLVDAPQIPLGTYDICEDGSGNIPRLRVLQNTRTGLETVSGPSVTWYRNDLNNLVQTGGTSFNDFQRSGSYFAVIDEDGCITTTEPVQINISPLPARPVIETEGSLEFCEGEGSVTLTAPDGAHRYRWYKDGVEISTGDTGTANSRTITVQQAGDYTVRVETAGGCLSDLSPVTALNTLPTPVLPGGVTTNADEICGSGTVNVRFDFNSSSNQEYRLIDAQTSLPLSDWRQGGGFITIASTHIEASETMKLETRFMDQSGCGVIEGLPFKVDIRGNLFIGEDGTEGVPQLPMETYDICEDGSGTTPRLTVLQNSRTGLELANISTVKWYRDDLNNLVQSGGSSFNDFRRSGAYFAVIDEDGCITTTESVQVNVTPVPERPVISTEGHLEFCEGEGTVVLTAPEGAHRYRWYRDGTEMSAAETGSDNSHTVTVRQAGEYTVRLETAAGCMSSFSPAVQLSALPAPTAPPVNVTTNEDEICGPGAVNVTFSSLSTQEYRLVNVSTGLPLSEWQLGGGLITIASDPIEITTTIRLETRFQEQPGCGVVKGSSFLVNIRGNLFIGEDLMEGVPQLPMETYDICEDGSGMTPRLTVLQNSRTGLELANISTVKWYRDDLNNLVQSGGSSFNDFRRSGAYFAVIDEDGCITTTESVQVNVTPVPERPIISTEGHLEFCEGEGTVVLTAPEGAHRYRWYRDGTEMSAAETGSDNSHTVTVRQAGEYTVRLETAAGCMSAFSPAVQLSALPAPTAPPVNVTTNEDEICGPGAVNVTFSSLSTQEYRLVDVSTGLPLSEWHVGGGRITITSGTLEMSTTMKLETKFRDQHRCGVMEGSHFQVRIRSLKMEVKGNRITANLGVTTGAQYTWFRDGQIISNAIGGTISIYDNAKYSVEVRYDDHPCVLTGEINSDPSTSPEANNKSHVDVYPNPAQDMVSVKVANNYHGEVMLRLTDMNGRIMIQEKTEKETEEQTYLMYLDKLNVGVYYLQVIYKGNVENMRIVKK